jgi:hypothetical protein
MTNLNDAPSLPRPVQFQLQFQHRRLQPLQPPPLVPPEAQRFLHISPTRQSLLFPDPRLRMPCPPRTAHPTGLSAKIRHYDLSTSPFSSMRTLMPSSWIWREVISSMRWMRV